jgi:hypothetical protein
MAFPLYKIVVIPAKISLLKVVTGISVASDVKATTPWFGLEDKVAAVPPHEAKLLYPHDALC